jgi:N-acyl homoserine lactone hydrolase
MESRYLVPGPCGIWTPPDRPEGELVIDIFPLHLTDVSFPDGHPQAGERGSVFGFALVQQDGVLLFDSGVGIGHPEIDSWFRPEHHPLPDALQRHSLSVSDVVAVVNSHLHFDHCGQNRLFAGKPIYVQTGEYRVVREPDYTVPEWVDFPGAGYELLDGEAELLPGVRALPTPGHTRGHQSLLVDSEGGQILLAGQAVYTWDEWEGSNDPRHSGEPSSWNRQAYAASVSRLRELDPARVLFAHDERTWQRADANLGQGG